MSAEIFTGKDLSKAFNSGVDAVVLECNKRIVNADRHIASADYIQGYKDALGELLEHMEYDIEEPKVSVEKQILMDELNDKMKKHIFSKE